MVRGQSLAAEKFSASTGLGDIEAVLRERQGFAGNGQIPRQRHFQASANGHCQTHK